MPEIIVRGDRGGKGAQARIRLADRDHADGDFERRRRSAAPPNQAAAARPPPVARPAPADAPRDSRRDRWRRSRRSAARPPARCGATRSIAVLARRVSGISAGRISVSCASHSAAIAAASAAFGMTRGRFAGVLIGLPSSATEWPPRQRKWCRPCDRTRFIAADPARRKGLRHRRESRRTPSSAAYAAAAARSLARSPPCGCGIASARACRCSRCEPGGPARCAAAAPYLPSPRIGAPIAAQCARSWCVRPVTGSNASQLARSPTLSMTR